MIYLSSVSFNKSILILALLFLWMPQVRGAQYEQLSAYQLQKIERRLKEQLSCLGCHGFGDEGGGIAPDLLQVRDRLVPEAVRDMIAEPRAARPGTLMPRIPMPADKLDQLVAYLFQHRHPEMQKRDIWKVVSYAGIQVQAPELYLRHCAACHGTDGAGNGVNASNLTPAPADFTNSNAMRLRTDDTLFDIIAVGGRPFDLSHHMPPWGGTLSTEEIRALVQQIREFCECSGPAWSRDGKLQ